VHDILGGLITHMFPPGPMGFQSSNSAPDWFLQDSGPDAADRILKIVADHSESFCARQGVY
jgi:hypothetical protein